MNRMLKSPFLLGWALMMLAALACQITPTSDQDVPREPTTVSLPEPTQPAGSLPPTATTVGSSSEYQTPVTFSEADCACGGLAVSKAFPWGESIECRYDWSGANVDDNRLGFQLARDYHVEQWNEKFARDSEDMKAEYFGGWENQVVNEFLNAQDAYGFMTTRKGWSRDDMEIATCGFGQSEELYAGEWLIFTDLRSCEVPNSMEGYLAQFQTVQQCARDLVNVKMK